MVVNIIELLRKHNLRVTSCRKDILSLFIESDFALCQAYLEKHLPDHYDRVSIYRTLHVFEEKGLIHKVLDDQGTLHYALCGTCCDTIHNHDHIHFKCRICGKTQCIESVDIPSFDIPSGFIIETIGLLVTGVCRDCNAS